MPRLLVFLVLGLAASPDLTAQEDRVERLVADAKQSSKAKAYARALALLKSAYRLAPDRDDIQLELGQCCLELGIGFYDAKRFTRARDAFHDGLRWQPANPGLWLGLAHVERRRGDTRAAEQAFRKVLIYRKDNFESLFALGGILFEQRRYTEAAALLARALEQQPKNKTVKKMLERAARDAHIEHGFKDFASDDFLVRFNGKRAGLERFVPEIMSFLGRTHEELSRVLGREPKQPVVVIFYTKTEFRRLNRTADWIRAYYDGKVRVPLDSWASQKRRVQKTLRHEVSHAFLYAISTRITPWVQEGFAQWFEGERLDRARDPFRYARMLPAPLMRRSFVQVGDERLVAGLYGQSLVMFGYLHAEQGMAGVRRFLAAVAAGSGRRDAREEGALKLVYGKGLAGLLRAAAAKHHLVAPPR